MNVTPAYYLCSTVLQLSSQILPRIRGASLRQTKIIIRYIHIRYTRFVAEFYRGFEYVALFHMLFVKFIILNNF